MADLLTQVQQKLQVRPPPVAHTAPRVRWERVSLLEIMKLQKEPFSQLRKGWPVLLCGLLRSAGYTPARKSPKPLDRSGAPCPAHVQGIQSDAEAVRAGLRELHAEAERLRGAPVPAAAEAQRMMQLLAGPGLPPFPDEAALVKPDLPKHGEVFATGRLAQLCFPGLYNVSEEVVWAVALMSRNVRLRAHTHFQGELPCTTFTPRTPGVYTLTVFRLGAFVGFQEANYTAGEPCAQQLLQLNVEVAGAPALPAAPCGRTFDFQGGWYRLASPACQPPFCIGHLGTLGEGSHWVYVPRDCYLRIYSLEEAAAQLNGKWISLWGDSNQQVKRTSFSGWCEGGQCGWQ